MLRMRQGGLLKTLAHLKIRESLGRGGMGEVCLAEDTKLDRQVALKVLPADLTAGEDVDVSAWDIVRGEA